MGRSEGRSQSSMRSMVVILPGSAGVERPRRELSSSGDPVSGNRGYFRGESP